jgi:hypothetical protein
MNHIAKLKPSSPFFRIFADGEAPIKQGFAPVKVELEGSDEKEAYLLDWSRCTVAQRIALAEAIAKEFGNVTPEKFRSYMNEGGNLPIRVSSTVSATLGVDTRFLL